ncbi:diphthine--ammonia ligase [Halobacillus trueperi]|uniref:Diphthine--ammonia ligase n=1 Tax=Halobacillus trueperi TaxID=156205 RepID=A0A3E0J5K3_9BACI|nr:diphthine--ammonia ligase [Halobacillus trueperi]REJ08170.1 diphthine--ammonia ligase [Halobacillus trueperi]
MPENVIVSWSGGKDSALALQKVMDDEKYEVKGLFSTVSEKSLRLPVHEVNENLLKNQADAIGLPLEVVTMPERASNEVYDEVMKRLFHGFKDSNIDRVVYADLFLEDIRAFRDDLLKKNGMTGIYPLWGLSSHKVAEEVIEKGFQAIITTVDTEKLNERLPGVRYDRKFLHSLSSEVDPCGEYGEFHTFVFDGPLFYEPLKIQQGERFETLSGRFSHVEMNEM